MPGCKRSAADSLRIIWGRVRIEEGNRAAVNVGEAVLLRQFRDPEQLTGLAKHVRIRRQSGRRLSDVLHRLAEIEAELLFEGFGAHVHEHALGAHEAGIQPHHRDFRFLESAAHPHDQAIQELVAEIPQHLSAIGGGIGMQVVGNVNDEAMFLFHHDAGGVHAGEPGGVERSGGLAPEAGAEFPERFGPFRHHVRSPGGIGHHIEPALLLFDAAE